MIDPQKEYGRLVSKIVSPILKTDGFKRRGSTFGKLVPDGWGVINFQKSPFSTRDSVAFTINLAFFSRRLCKFWKEQFHNDRVPLEHLCHLRKGIGELLRAKRDKWWTVQPTTNVDQVSTNVVRAVNDHAIPWVQEKCSDRSIIRAPRAAENAWLRPPGSATLMRELQPMRFETECRRLWKQFSNSGPPVNFTENLRGLGWVPPQ